MSTHVSLLLKSLPWLPHASQNTSQHPYIAFKTANNQAPLTLSRHLLPPPPASLTLLQPYWTPRCCQTGQAGSYSRAFALVNLLPGIYFLQISTGLPPSASSALCSGGTYTRKPPSHSVCELEPQSTPPCPLSSFPLFHRTHHHRMHFILVYCLLSVSPQRECKL